MANIQIDPQLLNVAIAELPAIIDWFKARHAKANPDAPALTSEEIIATFQEACRSTLAIDSQWKADHPE